MLVEGQPIRDFFALDARGVAEAGHLPQIEQPGATFGALDAFIRKNPGRPAV